MSKLADSTDILTTAYLYLTKRPGDQEATATSRTPAPVSSGLCHLLAKPPVATAYTLGPQPRYRGDGRLRGIDNYLLTRFEPPVRETSLLRRSLVVLASLLALLAVTSCSGPEPVETSQVVVRNRRFEPPAIRTANTSVVWWSNADTEEHVISFRGMETTELHLPPRNPKGEQRGFMFSEPGEYEMFCKIHGFKGKVISVKSPE